ncbi:MAG TPA: hypothetical protein VF932_14335 [Anaerolineae bacterium]
MKKLLRFFTVVLVAISLVVIWWMGGARLVAQVTVGVLTPTATATLHLLTVEGGVAEVNFEKRQLLLDERAMPYTMVELTDDTDILTVDQHPISLLDLRSGDLVRVEGTPSGGTTLFARRLRLVQAVARTIPTASPCPTPRQTPTITATPSLPSGDRLPLPGTLLIADSGNSRILEVTPDKKIIWEFPGPQSLEPGQKFFTPDDAFFTPGFKTILANEERYHQIVEIDYATRKIIWSFGEWGVAGGDDQHLNTPDDAYRLADGRTVVAEIRNCRIAIIGPQRRIVGQIGKTGQCKSEPGYLFKPNGDTPLPNGHLLVSEIGNHRVSEIDLSGNVIRSVVLPRVTYPSDAQLTRAGNVLVAAYEKPGRIVEVDWSGQIVWEYFPRAPGEQLDRPSLAIELPNGNIAFNDDFNHRVAIINRDGKTLWQYGVTGIPGQAPGYLYIPDGIDFRPLPISQATLTAVASITPPRATGPAVPTVRSATPPAIK